jgi:hypothetical protein
LKVLPLGGIQVGVKAFGPFGLFLFFGLMLVPGAGQLSVTVGSGKFTTAEHWPGLAVVERFAGQVIEGGCRSLTVTVKEQAAGLPLASAT